MISVYRFYPSQFSHARHYGEVSHNTAAEREVRHRIPYPHLSARCPLCPEPAHRSVLPLVPPNCSRGRTVDAKTPTRKALTQPNASCHPCNRDYSRFGRVFQGGDCKGITPGPLSWLWILTVCSPVLTLGAEAEWMVDKQPTWAALRAVVHTPQSSSIPLL